MNAEYYYFTYLLILSIISIALSSRYLAYSDSRINKNYKESFTLTFSIYTLITLFIGFRPVSSVFVDMVTYKEQLDLMSDLKYYEPDVDILFRYFQYFSARIMTASQWFTLMAALYFGGMLWVCRRLFPKDTLLTFIMCLSAFSTFAYGTNGLRNGIATSLALVALTYLDRKYIALSLLLIASQIHNSMYLVLMVSFITYFYKNTKTYIMFWITSIFLSLFTGMFFQNFFAGFIDDKRVSYLTLDTIVYGGKGGFRWDFLLYSIIPILSGYYFVVKKNFNDEKYKWLLNTYILVNAFWVLVIRASFSNRFSYLSWFLYAIVLIYPFLKSYSLNRQYSKMITVFLLHLLFTIIMYVITIQS